jgi:hypothetical protein
MENDRMEIDTLENNQVDENNLETRN